MKKLVLFLLLALPLPLASQVENVAIQWDTLQNRLFFTHALYEDSLNSLPYYTRKLKWDHPGKVPRVSVRVRKVSDPGESAWSGMWTGHVQEAPLVESELVREAGTFYVQLKILPFIRKTPEKLERVDSLEIILEPRLALAKLKSTVTGDWSGQSVLASGDWYRVAVEQSGIHRLTYEQLAEIGLSNPATARVYGSGAKLLPEMFLEGHTDDLSPVPVYMDKGSDGLFGPGDFLLFYARGPVSWNYSVEEEMFNHHLHTYSWRGFYFLTSDMGTADPPEELSLSTLTPSYTVNTYDFRDHLEEETYNLINSGKEWFGDNFNVNLQENYPFALPSRVPDEPLQIAVRAAARSNDPTRFRILANNDQVGFLEINGTNLSNYTATYAYENRKIFTYLPSQDNVTVTLEYERPDANSDGWLNFITLQARSLLRMTGDELLFRDSRSAGPENVAEFRLEGSDASTLIWDVTDAGNPKQIPYTLSGSTATFRLDTDELREFAAFRTGGSFPSPIYGEEGLGRVENQNLHGLEHPDMVIITPAGFLEEAQRLADHRESNDGLYVAVVLQQQVFNEFSSGTPDVTAIRNFMKMFYDRSGGGGGDSVAGGDNGNNNACRYLLLFGDGSYDNRGNPELANNPNLILTYQSDNSLSPTRSYVSDDYFGLLDTNEAMYSGLLDIGIGRLPVSDLEEASDMVDKITGYSDAKKQGEWRNQICFIGDDEDSNIHMRQAEELASYVQERYPAYNLQKIYLDAYPQEELATGPRYPDVTRLINNQVNRGSLIINYTGHGGPNGLAHEKITTTNDIGSWSNQGMLPLFMTATCEFSRYDEYDRKEDQEKTSAGEEVLLSTSGGGIGLFTTTRLVYSGPNHVLNERFYEVVFEKDENQENYRLGDIILYSKNNTGAGINKRNFTLLGDPSMRLAYPQHRVVTDSINGYDIRAVRDTLSAFQWVTVAGHLESQTGAFMNDFNGTVYPVVFDKERTIETLSNDNDPVWSYRTRNNILYSGKATVTGGRFSFGFFVPKDINYSFGPGKISYYSENNVVDAHGSSEEFLVGGIGVENATDSQPPQIELFMNDTFFVSGGATDPHPTLLAYVSDNYGINTTGNGIGHDLTAILNDDRINAVILNEFYQAGTNSYNSGIIRYPYSNLDPGRHELTVKIWDIHNNSASETLEFVVFDSEEMLLERLSNFPNPFVEETWFSIEHNRPDRELRLLLTIYNLSGEMVRVIDRQIFSPGYRIEPLRWDGTSGGGDRLPGGIYLYRVTLSTGDGEVAANSGKLIISR